MNGVVEAIIGSNMGLGIEFLLGPHNLHSVRFGQQFTKVVYAFVGVCMWVSVNVLVCVTAIKMQLK